MKPPMSVRQLTLEGRQQLEAGRHASDAFTWRRGQSCSPVLVGSAPPRWASS